MKKAIYVASRATETRAAMWKWLRDSQGWPIVSTWIDEAAVGATQSFTELWLRPANEIRNATHFVLYVEKEDFPLKGALIEAGMALAYSLPVYAVINDVELEPRNCRPLGSWVNHPNVSLVSNLELLGTVLGV